MEKLPTITKAKQVGKNYNVVLGEETFTVTGTKEELAPIKEAVAKYDAKGTKANHAALLKLLKPATTEKKEKAEKEETKVKAEIKMAKKKVVKKEATASKGQVNLVKELASQLEAGEVSAEDKKAMKKLLQDLVKEEEKSAPKPQATPTPRGGGEYGRRR